MLVIDTNVLVYAADRECPEHAACRRVLDDARRSPLPWHLTWTTIYEFLRVVSHPRVFRKPWNIARAWEFVEVLLESPSLSILQETGSHGATAKLVMGAVPGLRGNAVHDAHIVALMREHGVRRVCTRDAEFHRFDSIEVVDPLATT